MSHRGARILLLFLLAVPYGLGLSFDDLAAASGRRVADGELEALVSASAAWLRARSLSQDNPLLRDYAGKLSALLRPSCTRCVDYFEAVVTLRSLSSAVGGLLAQQTPPDGGAAHWPVVRRSYVAAVWLLQRSRMYAWGASQLGAGALGTMYRLYLRHVADAKGRAVAFHHVSKSGGTTMCQLAGSNRCSNPAMDEEHNCVLNSRLDGPIWMVAHDIHTNGTSLHPLHARLGVVPTPPLLANMTLQQRALVLRNYSYEPELPMWLMYSCPGPVGGKPHDCPDRVKEAANSRSTFLANERALPWQDGMSQACPQFTNVIILRNPVPHVVSLLAEVRFRYNRQLRMLHGVRNWQPPGWNLAWWERFGPALVGSYATRTLAGRDAFCEPAAALSEAHAAAAADVLLGFDIVATLDRPNDIDLTTTALLGWPARKFSSQPAFRVRSVEPLRQTMAKQQEPGWEDWSLPSSQFSGTAAHGPDGPLSLLSFSATDWPHAPASQPHTPRQQPQGSSINSTGAAVGGLAAIAGSSAASWWRRGSQLGSVTGSSLHEQWGVPATRRRLLQGSDSDGASSSSGSGSGSNDNGDDGDTVSDAELEAEARVLYASPWRTESAPSPPATVVPRAELEARSAMALARQSYLQRALEAAGGPSVSLVTPLGELVLPTGLPEPRVRHTQQFDAHGGHLVEVLPSPGSDGSHGGSGGGDTGAGVNTTTAADEGAELWHAFPRHGVAFSAADMTRLEALTALDERLLRTADVLLDVDAAWLRSLLQSAHYRKRMRSAADTHAACGFAGMLPLSRSVAAQVLRDSSSSTRPWPS